MPSPRPPRLTLSVKIDAATVLKVRQLARDFSGKPHYLRLNEIVATSLRRFIEDFQRLHGDGGDDAEPIRARPSRNSQPSR